MLKLFSSIFPKRKTEQQIIAEIHNEFDTAEDRLLMQADNLLKELKIPTESDIEHTAKRLNAIGFSNTPAVKQADHLREIRKKQTLVLVETKEQADRIKSYKQEYPFQKFLTENELDRICKKYGLVYAPVKNYIKNIPEKNLAEIERAKPLSQKFSAPNYEILILQRGYFTLGCPRYIKTACVNGIVLKRPFSGNNSAIRDFFGVDAEYYQYSHIQNTLKTIERTGLFICAPITHFDKKGLSKKGLGFFKTTTIVQKDPIVFRYVKGGVQVLSKWGLEASDEALMNEINN